MKILTFTTLYPNAVKPAHGIFVETRLRHLVATQKVESRVVAPVPWFPSRNARFGRYAGYANVPPEETRSGLKILHPRYLSLPKIGMSVSPFLLANAAKPAIGKLIDEGYDFDLIDAHYFYPDGVAAVMLGRYFNRPTVITARGSDISLIPQHRIPRRMIKWAADRADGIITVCNALKDEIVRLGVKAEKVVSLRNGVDLELFKPVDRPATRKSLGMEGFTILSVGNLVPVKGHDLTIKSLALLPDARLLIAGTGPERNSLASLAKSLGVENRIKFLGSLTQEALRNYYGAADVLVLASTREGWANVLLESMACGTPVVASNVWGTPEVVASFDAGLLMEARTPEKLAAAVSSIRSRSSDPAATRQYAEHFDWNATSAGQIDLFCQILHEKHSFVSA